MGRKQVGWVQCKLSGIALQRMLLMHPAAEAHRKCRAEGQGVLWPDPCTLARKLACLHVSRPLIPDPHIPKV